MNRLNILLVALILVVIFIINKSPNNIKKVINDNLKNKETSMNIPEKINTCNKPEQNIVEVKIEKDNGIESFTSPYAISYNNFYYDHNKDENINIYSNPNWLYGVWNRNI